MKGAWWMLAVLLVPAGLGQTTWNDALGDVDITFRSENGDNEVPNEGDWYRHFDIESASIEESEDALMFTVIPRQNYGDAPDTANGEAPDQSPEPINHVETWIHFTFHGEERAIRGIWWIYDRTFPINNFLGHFEDTDGDGQPEFIADARLPETPLDGKGWSMTLSKWDLRDSQMVPVRQGDALEDIRFEHRRMDFDGGLSSLTCAAHANPPTVTIRPGDCGTRPVDVLAVPDSIVVQQSAGGIQNLLIESEAPLRASNGLATTYVYDVQVRNLGTDAQTVRLAATDIPSEWDVRFPKSVHVAAGAQETVRVLLDVPFQHQHGSEATFNFTAVNADDPSDRSQLALGVVWTAVPQPGGHHPALFFHGTHTRSWMNTLQTDEASTRVEVSPTYTSSATMSGGLTEVPTMYYERAEWDLFLRPGLQMGLDGNPGEPVTGTISIGSDAEYTVDDASLVLWTMLPTEAEPTILAQQPLDGAVVPAGGRWDIDVNMELLPAGDLLPFEPGRRLALSVVTQGHLDLQGGTVHQAENLLFVRVILEDGEQPRTEPVFIDGSRSSIHLPLEDYHDIVAGDIASKDAVETAAQAAAETAAKDTPTPFLGTLLLLAGARRMKPRHQSH